MNTDETFQRHFRSAKGSPFQRLCVAAARTELENQWCADVISTYNEGDRVIVEMTFAAYIAWLMHRAFTQVLPRHETADAIGSVMSDFSTQPWYQAHVFRPIAEKVSERMPKAFSQKQGNDIRAARNRGIGQPCNLGAGQNGHRGKSNAAEILNVPVYKCHV
jgi:hypothetical protein